MRRIKGASLTILFAAISSFSCQSKELVEQTRPNVILIVTDDQGFGDFGFKGNPVLRTPSLDQLAKNGAQLNSIYVNPVCAPTRAALMTGRYPYRTRAIDTFIGRAMMEPNEVTIAEVLSEAGYATGIFGKWHLGDNYPMRAMDQGFEEAVVHRGGGIGQPSDPPGAEGNYTDPILFNNGEAKRYLGYCTDIYFDEAMRWMDETREEGRPFFAYIPTNAPHTPLDDVPEKEYAYYNGIDLSNEKLTVDYGNALPAAKAVDHEEKKHLNRRARIYSMIENIDSNIGRLVRKLENDGELENTLIVFMTDNGPNGIRFNGGLKGMKADIYEGGIKSPFIAHWPKRLYGNVHSNTLAANIDVMPTILDALEVPLPDVLMDGKSFFANLEGELETDDDRHIVIQSHRGDRPYRYHNFALITPKWKMTHPSGFHWEKFSGQALFELYDLSADPYEFVNLADEYPVLVDSLVGLYDNWFDEVGSTRPDNYTPPRIHIGTDFELTTILTRQDWRHYKGKPWAEYSNGYWRLKNDTTRTFDVKLRYPLLTVDSPAKLSVNDYVRPIVLPANTTEYVLYEIPFKGGEIDFSATIDLAYETMGPHQVELSPAK